MPLQLIPKEKLDSFDDDAILNEDPRIFTDQTVDVAYVDAFMDRCLKISGVSDFVAKLNDSKIATDRTSDSSIAKSFDQFSSDMVRLASWRAVTNIPREKISNEKGRLSAIFKLLGPAYTAAVKRVKDHKWIAPYSHRDVRIKK